LNIAYLILAHDTPRNVSQLIAALRHPSHRFFVHVDAKSEMSAFAAAQADDVAFVQPRVKVYWGDFSQVEASLVLLRAAFNAPMRFDYFVLISGSDYPLYRAEDIQAFFASAREAEFISTVPIPCEAAGKGPERMSAFKPAGDPATLSYRLAALGARALRHSRNYRSGLGALRPLAGSSWWAITRSAAAATLEFVEREQSVVRFFRNSVCPDESFFQTVIGNSPRKGHVQRGLVFADWSGGGASPARIGHHHLPLFADHLHPPPSDPYGPGIFLFARKLADEADDIRAAIAAMSESKRLSAASAS
jgi:hypothetical protein